jgi:hypothetical protein
MSSLYRRFLYNFLGASWSGTQNTTLVTMSATPAVKIQGVTSDYVFDPTHTVEADFSPYATEFLIELDGEDDTACWFYEGVLYFVDGTSVTTTEETAGLVIWVDHGGSGDQLVRFIDVAYGLPLAASPTPVLEWPVSGVFEMLQTRGVGKGGVSMYPKAAEEAMAALIGGSTRTVLPADADLRCDLLIESAQFIRGHRYVTDIPAAWWAIGPGVGDPQVLSGVSRSVSDSGDDGARFDYSATVTFALAAGSPAYSVIFWEETTGILVGFCPLSVLGAGVAAFLVLNGSNVDLEFTQDTGILTLRAAA